MRLEPETSVQAHVESNALNEHLSMTLVLMKLSKEVSQELNKLSEIKELNGIAMSINLIRISIRAKSPSFLSRFFFCSVRGMISNTGLSYLYSIKEDRY